jgi:hypothetical protein
VRKLQATTPGVQVNTQINLRWFWGGWLEPAERGSGPQLERIVPRGIAASEADGARVWPSPGRMRSARPALVLASLSSQAPPTATRIASKGLREAGASPTMGAWGNGAQDARLNAG